LSCGVINIPSQVGHNSAAEIFRIKEEARKLDIIQCFKKEQFNSIFVIPSVSKKLLLDMFNHTVNVRIWDTKDKVSVRAKFDRPKVFRLPPPPGPKPVDARFDGGKTKLQLRITLFIKHLMRLMLC